MFDVKRSLLFTALFFAAVVGYVIFTSGDGDKMTSVDEALAEKMWTIFESDSVQFHEFHCDDETVGFELCLSSAPSVAVGAILFEQPDPPVTMPEDFQRACMKKGLKVHDLLRHDEDIVLILCRGGNKPVGMLMLPARLVEKNDAI